MCVVQNKNSQMLSWCLPCILLISMVLLFLISIHSVYAESNISDDETLRTGEAEEETVEDVLDISKTKPAGPEVNNIVVGPEEVQLKTATIIALNKITAKSQELKLHVGESKYFYNIEIKIHKCIKNLDKYLPDNKVLLTITEYKINEDPATVFQGWLFSSNLSISTFEHPVYEVFPTNCI